MKRIVLVSLLVVCSLTSLAQQRSAKRGVGWDESKQPISAAPVGKMAPGISWYYNWGLSPQDDEAMVGPEGAMAFVPMCWNGGFSEATLRNYLTAHPGVKYLLGFNEPNFSSQSNMTPQQAADAWQRVEQIATDYGLLVVAPALNFSGEKVGGRTWNPYEWYDEFFRLRPEARVDFLALHCYMNWYSSTLWFATEYFYKDLYDPSKTDAYGRYPHLKAFLDNYQQTHGHLPRMFLTEFCAWENDGTITGVDFQINQMTQKVQLLEKSDIVEAYAWFMANDNKGAASYPYMSIFQTNTPQSELSTLGKVYVYMSSFDAEKWYTPGDDILAKDYIDAALDSQQPLVRPNSEEQSDIPLQVEWPISAWTAYQLLVPSDGAYTLTLNMKTSTANSFRIYDGALGAANKRLDTTLASTGGQWADVTTEVTLTAGQHTLLLYNMGPSSIVVNKLRFEASATGVGASLKNKELNNKEVFNLQGQRVSDSYRGIVIVNGKKAKR